MKGWMMATSNTRLIIVGLMALALVLCGIALFVPDGRKESLTVVGMIVSGLLALARPMGQNDKSA